MPVNLPFDKTAIENWEMSRSVSGVAFEVRDVEGDSLHCSECMKGWEDAELQPLRELGVVPSRTSLRGAGRRPTPEVGRAAT